MGLPFFVKHTPSTLLNGLLGFWPMDEASGNAADVTGNGFTGTNQNTTPFTTGLIGNAANINTLTRGFSVSSTIDTRASTTPFTVSLWFNDAGGAGGGAALIGEWGTRNDWVIFNPSLENATLRTSDNSGTTTDVAASAQFPCCSLGAGNWTHILVGYDGVNTFLTLNNGTPATGSPANVRRGGGVFGIGNYQGFTLGWAGFIDMVGYWDRELTSTEKAYNYNGGVGRTFPFS